jgi:hypothetical protein
MNTTLLKEQYGLISFDLNRKDYIDVIVDKSSKNWGDCFQKIKEIIPTVIY